MTLLAPLLIFLHLGVPVELWSPILDAADSTEDVALLSVTAHEETGGTWADKRGDFGHSVSVFQLWVCPGPLCERVQRDIHFASAEALRRIRSSMRRCAGQLNEYLRGNCEPLQQATNRLANVRRAMR